MAVEDDSELWPIWETRSGTVSVFDPEVIRDICIAEQNTNAVLKEKNLCTTCFDGECMPPFSLVLYARIAVGDATISLSCEDLAEQWSQVKDSIIPGLQQCADDIKATKEYNPLPTSCPDGFYPSMVDSGFGKDNPSSRYTSSVFVTSSKADDLYEQVGEYDRATSSSVVSGTYDTASENFVGLFADSAVLSDMSLAMGSAFVTTIAILIHTRSPWLTMIGIFQIILSFPLAFFVYTFVGQLEFFPFLNFIGVFVVFALGADDIFVAVDKWKNARLEMPYATTEDIAAKALPDAATAMFLTTVSGHMTQSPPLLLSLCVPAKFLA